jgi:hypothetical protein
MRYERNERQLSAVEKWERVVFLVALIVLALDLFVWRP